MGVKLKDIAIAAGVSEGTASLAINGRPGVNDDTRRRVLEIVREMGYCASASAKSLAKKRSGLIGILVPNISNPFYSGLVRGIENQFRNKGYKMILATTENSVAYERTMLEQFVSFDVEGVFIYPIIHANPDPTYLNILKKNGIPFIFIGSYYRGVDASHVMSNIYQGICSATEHLHHSGCRNFYYFGGTRSIVSNEMKVLALQDTLKIHDLTFDPHQFVDIGDITYDNAYRAAEQLFKRAPSVDAIISGDAYTSIAIYRVAIKSGYRVPEDLSIVSFDNLIPPEICIVHLTCLEQNLTDMVQYAVEELFCHMSDPQYRRNILLDTKLILRETTKH